MVEPIGGLSAYRLISCSNQVKSQFGDGSALELKWQPTVCRELNVRRILINSPGPGEGINGG
jgi:hypothetical protein